MVNTVSEGTIINKNTEPKIIQSIRPTLRQHWLRFIVFAFSIFLAFKAFDVHTITGLSIVSISGLLTVYTILSVYTTRCVVTQQGILVRKGPFSIKFKEISYRDINNILITQGSMQKRFKIGNLIINNSHASYVLKGIKNPHKTKELMNREKAAEYERRTLLRKML